VSLEILSLKTLSKLDDEKVMKALAAHLRRASLDCHDRPGDSKPRKVTMEISLVPVLAEDLTCDEVKSQIQIKSTLPAHRTKIYSFGLKASGALVFNPDSLDAVDQGTLLPDDEE